MSAKLRTLFIFAGFLFFVPGLEILPEEPRAYVWYDGNTPHKIWLQPDVVAEFGLRPGQKSRLGFKAQGLNNSRPSVVRIWKLSKGSLTRSLAKGRMPAGMAGNFSPVFTRGKTGRGPKLSLPGGLIIYFDKSWTHAGIEKWAGARGLV